MKIIVIATSGDLFKASESLGRMGNNLPMMSRSAMRRWGFMLAKDMQMSARRSGIQDFTGNTQERGIEWRQGPQSDWGYLFMRQYHLYLDSMKPHFVAINRRRTRLLAWAGQAQNAGIRRKAMLVEQEQMKSFAIFVRPHPFIANGWRVARPKLRPILAQEARNAIVAS